MNDRRKRGVTFPTFFLTIIVLISAAGMYLYKIYPDARLHDIHTLKDSMEESETAQTIMDTLPKRHHELIKQTNGKEEKPTVSGTETEIEKEMNLVPLDAEKAVMLSDIYSESGKDAVFCCFDKEASSYIWEIYNMAENKWMPVPEDATFMEPDELGRKMSWMKVSALKETTVRCTLKYPEKEEEIQTASLYLLKNSIEKISANDYVTDPDTNVCIGDIPITVTYKDKTKETLTGLSGLFFLIVEEETDCKTGIKGNREETTISSIFERNYLKIGAGEKETQIRYHRGNGQYLEATCTVKGEDVLPPVISSVEIAPFTVVNTDIPTTLTVTIDAEDNKTSNQRLDYAFVLKGTPPEEIRWMKTNNFDVEITQNGTYAACARDEAGNTTKEEVEVITVDMKPPTVHVFLETPTGWCQSNKIKVDATDASKMQYSFRHTDDATTPHWSDIPTCSIEKNGTYIIKVRDAAGNITETEITVNNIDRESPVIQGIYEK